MCVAVERNSRSSNGMYGRSGQTIGSGNASTCKTPGSWAPRPRRARCPGRPRARSHGLRSVFLVTWASPDADAASEEVGSPSPPGRGIKFVVRQSPGRPPLSPSREPGLTVKTIGSRIIDSSNSWAQSSRSPTPTLPPGYHSDILQIPVASSPRLVSGFSYFFRRSPSFSGPKNGIAFQRCKILTRKFVILLHDCWAFLTEYFTNFSSDFMEKAPTFWTETAQSFLVETWI